MKKIKLILVFIIMISITFITTGCTIDDMDDISIIVTNYPNEFIVDKIYSSHSTIKSIYPDGVNMDEYNKMINGELYYSNDKKLVEFRLNAKKLCYDYNRLGPDDINIAGLIKRVNELDNPEIIVALKSTIEGEATTLYIKKIFENKNILISRLSYGIPMGVDIDYLDELTLFNALNDRKDIS